jgi:hypothetical protein
MQPQVLVGGVVLRRQEAEPGQHGGPGFPPPDEGITLGSRSFGRVRFLSGVVFFRFGSDL